MSFHLRFTPYELDIKNLANFCDKFDKYIVAAESKSKSGQEVPLHYHIYIETTLDVDTVRSDFLKKLCIPKSGRGKNNKYYMLKVWDNNISYIVKQNNIKMKKGFTEEQIQEVVKSLGTLPAEGKNTTAAAPRAAKKEIESEWNKILANAINFWRENGKKEITYDKWVKLIMYWNLKELKPITHTANLKRYALSLDMLCHSGWGENDSELRKQIDQTPTLETMFQKSS